MKTTYDDRLLGYDDGRLVAIADSCGGEAWSIWHCRQVGHRAAELDTLGAHGEAAARRLMRDRLRCTRVVFSRGTEPRPAAPVIYKSPADVAGVPFWTWRARNAGVL